MTILQPYQLKKFFTPKQEKQMQDDLIKYFTGKAKVGVHSVIMESPGRLTDYYVGFIVEQPNNPRPFIILVVVDAKVNTQHQKFVDYVDGIAAKADDLPQRKIAALRNRQTFRN